MQGQIQALMELNKTHIYTRKCEPRDCVYPPNALVELAINYNKKHGNKSLLGSCCGSEQSRWF